MQIVASGIKIDIGNDEGNAGCCGGQLVPSHIPASWLIGAQATSTGAAAQVVIHALQPASNGKKLREISFGPFQCDDTGVADATVSAVRAKARAGMWQTRQGAVHAFVNPFAGKGKCASTYLCVPMYMLPYSVCWPGSCAEGLAFVTSSAGLTGPRACGKVSKTCYSGLA
jgi:hypothetical protein